MRAAAVLVVAAVAAVAAVVPASKRQDDVNSILDELQIENPDDAAAVRASLQTPAKRNNDVGSILDPTIADTGISKSTPQDDEASILAALEALDPEDAAAAKSGKTPSKRQIPKKAASFATTNTDADGSSSGFYDA